MLTKQDIRQRLEVTPVEVEVESLDGTVYLREFTLGQRRAFAKQVDNEDFNADLWLVMNGVLNADGDLMFANGDEEWLTQEANGRIVQDMVKAIMLTNGWDPDAMEEAEGN